MRAEAKRRSGVGLAASYTLLSPFYDLIAGPAFERARRASLQPLQARSAADVFLDGVGTGLDLPHLPHQHRYTALDLTPAMLERALPRAHGLDVVFVQGNSESLPFAAESFDCAVLHLIVAVVQNSQAALSEAARVLKPGGMLLMLDKFLAPGAAAPLRRMLNPLASRIATRTDVVLEPLLAREPRLRIVRDEPALARGWFRRIVLERL